MSTIFPSIYLNDEQKAFINEPPHLLIQHIERFESKKDYKNQIFQNTLFGLCLSCFNKLNLNQIFEKKSTGVNSSIFSNFQSNLEIHNKEVEKRGFKVIQTLNAIKVEDNLKHIFGNDNETQKSIKLLTEDMMSFDVTKSIYNQLVIYFNKLAEHNHLPSIFQLVYIRYNEKANLTSDDKDYIEKNLDYCIKHNFLFADHFKGILMLSHFYSDKNQEDAIKHLLNCGKKGFSSSYCVLGELFEDIDIFKSIYYYDLAYKTGDVYAATMLGFIHLNKLLSYDEPKYLIPKALKYLEHAAKKGSVDARYMLGTVYYEDYMGLGYKTEDYEKSIFHLSKICEQKPEAYTLLGHIYFKLVFDPSYYNHPMNKKYLEMSDIEFKNFLSKNLILFIKDNKRENITFDNHPGISLHTQYALYYLSQGVNKDVLPCFYYLGYLFGKGVPSRIPVNYEQCFSLLEKGIEFNHEGCATLLKYFKEQEARSRSLTN